MRVLQLLCVFISVHVCCNKLSRKQVHVMSKLRCVYEGIAFLCPNLHCSVCRAVSLVNFNTTSFTAFTSHKLAPAAFKRSRHMSTCQLPSRKREITASRDIQSDSAVRLTQPFQLRVNSTCAMILRLPFLSLFTHSVSLSLRTSQLWKN